MGGGGKGGGGGGDTRSEVRFAPYLEDIHKSFLTGAGAWDYNLKAAFATAWGANPYADREDINIEDGLLGLDYVVSDFPSLFDMFGKFMAGLDIEVLWTQAYEQVFNGTEMDDLVASFNQSTQDSMNQKSLPMLNAGMRDIGSVNSSAYVVGKALLEANRLKEVTKFTAQIKYHGLQITQERWTKHLDWNQTVIGSYAELQKLYYAGKQDLDKLNYTTAEASTLWELNLFEYSRALMGALGGGSATAKGNDPSKLQSAIGGGLSGAATGAMVGSMVPGIGTAIGAGVGGMLGIASSFF